MVILITDRRIKMKYCIKCGAELLDEAIFCGKCGTNQTTAQLSAPAQTAQPEPIAPAPDGTAAVNKKSKLPLVIIICAAVLAVAAAVFFLFIFDATRINKSPQEKALDRYFEACEELDAEKVLETFTPSPDYNVLHQGAFMFWERTLGFHRGIPTFLGPQEFGVKNAKKYYKSYGLDFPDDVKDLETIRADDKDDLEKLYPDFSCDYELIKMKNADDVTVSMVNMGSINRVLGEDNATEIDIKEEIENAVGEDVGDVYVAQIKMKWACGDMEYGNDESWWKDKAFKKMITDNFRDYDDFSYSTYEKVVKSYEKEKYTVFIYECDGEWYVYPYNFASLRNTYKIDW